MRGAGVGEVINRDEFVALVHENQAAMYRLALGILKNEMDAEDAVSETITKAYIHLGKIRNPEKFKSWILTILSNESKTILQKRKKIELVEDVSFFEETTPEKNDELWSAVMSLHEKFGKVVILYYYNGFSTKEISKILKISEGTVKSRLSRARGKLKDILNISE